MLRFDTSWLQQSIGSVWREKLLLHKLNTGIPPTFICWICSFLIDCRGGVKLFNVFSSSNCFTQDLPQRSVLAPLLFLFYINDLASTVNDDAVIALFADDVSTSLQLVKGKMQKLLPKLISVATWSEKWKLNLNAGKSELCPFSTWSNTVPGTQLFLLVIRKSASTLHLVSSV